MYLDYSKLAFDKNGTPETPTLVLKTMHEETIGVIPGVYNLMLTLPMQCGLVQPLPHLRNSG